MDPLENYSSNLKRLPVADDLNFNAAGPLAAVLATISQKAALAAPTVSSVVALSDSALSQALVKWVTQAQPALVNSNPPIPYSSMVSFFSDTSNMAAVRQVMHDYGFQLTPLPSVGGKLLYGAGTWVPYWKMWKAAYYYKTFPIPPNDPSYCTEIGTMLPLVTQELANVKASQLQGNLTASEYTNTIFVLNDIQTTLTGLYGSMDCVSAEQSQQTQQNIGLLGQVTSSAISGSGSTGGSVLTYALYGVAGLMVIGALVIIFHHKKKSA